METLLCQTIASDMEHKIKIQLWRENEKLPSERILSEQYKVSRTVVREALKLLNEKNLVVTQPGRGNFVSRPGADGLISQFECLMDYNNIPLTDMVVAREELEVIIGQRAIQNVKLRQQKELEHIYELMEANLDDHPTFNRYDYAFHLQLAECSNNTALKMIFSSLYSVTGKNTFLAITSTPEIRRHAQKEHAQILSALKTRSPRNMTQAIRRHMKCIHEHLIVG